MGAAVQLRRELSMKQGGQDTHARVERAIGKLLRAKTRQVLKLLGEKTTSALLPLA